MRAAQDAIQEWKLALGQSNIANDDVTLERYARTTLDQGTRPSAILYPRTTEDVQAIVRIAARYGVVIYPVSRGRNLGYGDACAPTPDAAIIDLGRMNRIIEVNTELAYAVIEPGVSQRQLYEHLQTHKTGLWFDCSGAGFDASLVGNTLDRGFGHTRYGDHFLTACGMEVVLPDGRVLNTGFGHYPNARAARAYRYGVGPFLDGMFCQSNLGIVTRLGLWLMPEPEAFQFFFVRIERDEDLPALVDRLVPLRLSGVLQSAIHIGNDLRILSGKGGHPRGETQGPLSPERRALLRREAGIGAWSAAGSFTGTQAQVRAAAKALRKAVAGVGKIVFVDDRKLALGEFAAKCLGLVGLGTRLREQLAALRPNYGLLKGIPTNEPLLGTQWGLHRTLSGDGKDPLDSGCGLIWVSPVLPSTGRDVKAFAALVEPIFAQYGFDMLVTFTLITERATIAIMNVAFDKADAEETLRARRCYESLMDSAIDGGFYPYRTSLTGLSKLIQPNDVFWEVACEIKRALDPKDILARGRYIPALNTAENYPPQET